MLLGSKTIAENIQELAKQGDVLAQPELAKRMGIGSKTFWTLKDGSGNPQLENIEKAANYFRRPLWQLLVKNGYKLSRDFDPFKQPVPTVEIGHVRIAVLDAVPSAGPGGQPVDYPAVLDHIDVAESWARKRLGGNLDTIRALPVAGDSMSPTINEGDLAFVDTSCHRFEAEGIYVIVFNDSLLIKRLLVDLAGQRIEVRSDNEKLPTQYIASADVAGLAICGRVKAWLAVKGY
jgi:phage repressor protein C with HTH and peptisase S24 domain